MHTRHTFYDNNYYTHTLYTYTYVYIIFTCLYIHTCTHTHAHTHARSRICKLERRHIYLCFSIIKTQFLSLLFHTHVHITYTMSFRHSQTSIMIIFPVYFLPMHENTFDCLERVCLAYCPVQYTESRLIDIDSILLLSLQSGICIALVQRKAILQYTGSHSIDIDSILLLSFYSAVALVNASSIVLVYIILSVEKTVVGWCRQSQQYQQRQKYHVHVAICA